MLSKTYGNLLAVSGFVSSISLTHLKLNLGLSNVLLAATAAGNLLSLRNLVPYSLCSCQLKRQGTEADSRFTSALKSSMG
jgi:hypothetical protein